MSWSAVARCRCATASCTTRDARAARRPRERAAGRSALVVPAPVEARHAAHNHPSQFVTFASGRGLHRRRATGAHTRGGARPQASEPGTTVRGYHFAVSLHARLPDPRFACLPVATLPPRCGPLARGRRGGGLWRRQQLGRHHRHGGRRRTCTCTCTCTWPGARTGPDPRAGTGTSSRSRSHTGSHTGSITQSCARTRTSSRTGSITGSITQSCACT